MAMLGDSTFSVVLNSKDALGGDVTKTISGINYDREGTATEQPDIAGANADLLLEFATDVADSVTGFNYVGTSLTDKRGIYNV